MTRKSTSGKDNSRVISRYMIRKNYMDKILLYRFLYEVENQQLFALTKKFDELSLEDYTGGSSTSQVQPSSYRGTFHRFLRSWTDSLWSPSINEQLRAPFIELPRNSLWSQIINEQQRTINEQQRTPFFIELPSHLTDPSSSQSYDTPMGLGFRFLPDQSRFLLKEFKLPESFDRLSFLSHSLGLSYYSRPLSPHSLFPHSCYGAGFRGLVKNLFTKKWVEVFTYYNGRYGRFLVLVCLGLGCTVWYEFALGSELQPPEGVLFAPLGSYEPFQNLDYYAPGFRRCGFVERNDVSASVVSAFRNEHPFAEITIPSSGPVLNAIGLGVMVAFFLAVGLVPDVSGGINVLL